MKQSLALFAALSALVLVGCGAPQVTVKDSQGNETKIGTDGSVEVKSKDGTSSMTTKDGTTVVTDEKGNKATIQNEGSGMTFENDKGEKAEIGTGSVTEAELGLPFYPGSKHETDMKASQGRSVMSTRKTTDSIEKVKAFYDSKVKSENSFMAGEGGSKTAIFGGKLADGRSFQITLAGSATKETVISISVSGEGKS